MSFSNYVFYDFNCISFNIKYLSHYSNSFMFLVQLFSCIFRPLPPYYRYFLTFRFAIDEINKDSTILPNVTLGYHMYDSCADNRKAVKSALQILSESRRMVPNYSCRKRGKLVGFIGDQESVTTVSIAQILALYRYTQVWRLYFSNPGFIMDT